MKSRNAFQNPIKNNPRKQTSKAVMPAAATNLDAALPSSRLPVSSPAFRHEAKLIKLMLKANAAARNSPGLKSSCTSAAPGLAGSETGSQIINRKPLKKPDSSLIIKKSTKKSLPHQCMKEGSVCALLI